MLHIAEEQRNNQIIEKRNSHKTRKKRKLQIEKNLQIGINLVDFVVFVIINVTFLRCSRVSPTETFTSAV